MSIEVIEPSVVDVVVPHLVMVDHDAVVVIDGDEALVEGPIMEGVEQQPIRCDWRSVVWESACRLCSMCRGSSAIVNCGNRIG